MGIATGTWQIAVECGQVVAGVVDYPSQNPIYIHYVQLWTLVNQLSAALLRVGASERQASMLLSGLLGMVSYAALGLCTFACSRDRLVSVMVPCFVHWAHLYRFGVAYPLVLMGYHHPFGIIGTSFSLLTWAVLGVGWRRTGSIMLGLAPAVHASTGLWCFLAAAGALAWDWRHLGSYLRQCGIYFLLGVALSASSLAYQRSLGRDVPAVDEAVKTQYLRSYVENWDPFRTPPPLLHVGQTATLFVSDPYLGVILAVTCCVLCGWWLRYYQEDLEPSALFLLRVLCLASGLGVVLVVLSRFPGLLPAPLLILVPGRHVNVSILAFAPLVLGLLARHRARADINYLLLLVLVTVAILRTQPRWAHPYFTAPEYMRLVCAALVVGAVCLMTLRARPVSADLPGAIGVRCGILLLLGTAVFGLLRETGHARLPALFVELIGLAILLASYPFSTWRARSVALAGLTAVAVLGAAELRTQWDYRIDLLKDQSNDPVFAAASQKEVGLLLTGSDLYCIQMRTRRAVLLSGRLLDQLPYSLESAPEMDRILRRVYGVALDDPPPRLKEMHIGGMLPDTGRELWEGRSTADWQMLADEFHVSEVLTYADWKLDLPVRARSEAFVLYAIPHPDGENK
jgi:hypothetical protein